MKTILFAALMICAITLSAQHTVQGWVVDSTETSLPFTSIALTKQSDSSLVSFGVSNTQGVFVLSPVPAGSYRLQFSYMGYKNMFMNVEVDGSKKIVDLGKIELEENNNLLNAVSIEANAIPILLKKDTIEYNAGSFKTETNAVVEDLLKQLPGVEVDKNGKIKAQGKEVEKITVDGKEFFANDPKLASKNLPADAVDKVQVYDKKTDAAEFTGVDDGERIKTINLALKDDKKQGYFGLATGGYGNENRFSGSFNLNRFSKKLQLSAIGMSNNINEQGFSINDYINFMGGIQSLIAGNGMGLSPEGMGMMLNQENNIGTINSAAGGINGNYTFSENAKLNLNYFHNTIVNHTQVESDKHYSHHPVFGRATERSNLYAEHFSHSIGMKFKQKIDSSHLLVIQGSLGLNNGSAKEEALLHNYNQLLSPYSMSNNTTAAKKASTQYHLNAYYKYNLGKKGRLASIRLGLNGNDNANDELVNQNSNYTDTLVGQQYSLRQSQKQVFAKQSISGAVSYTEPIWKRHFLSSSYIINQSQKSANYKFYDIDATEQELLNSDQSNLLESTLIDHSVGLSWKSLFTNLKLNIGVDYNHIRFSGKRNHNQTIPTRTYKQLLPNAFLRYTLSMQSRLFMQYYTRTNTPSIRQLQPSIDNSALSHYYIGNPLLDPEYVHTASTNFHFYSMFSDISFFIAAQGSYTENRISNSIISDSSLIPTYMPINGGEGKNLIGHFDFSAPIRKLHIKINIGGQSMMDQASFVYNGELDQRTSLVNSLGLSIENRNKKIFNCKIGIDLSHTKTLYQNNQLLNNTFMQPQYYTDFKVSFLKSWVFKSSVNHLIYPEEMFGRIQTRTLWHAELTKSILHKKMTIGILARDILNQDNGLEYINQYDFEGQQRSNIIGRFFMLKLSYKLSALGK